MTLHSSHSGSFSLTPSEDPLVAAWRVAHIQGDLPAAEVILRDVLTAARNGSTPASLINRAEELIADVLYHRKHSDHKGCLRRPKGSRPMREVAIPVDMAGERVQ